VVSYVHFKNTVPNGGEALKMFMSCFILFTHMNAVHTLSICDALF
jgi:hypothetical protein